MNTASELAGLVERLGMARVLCVGDVMLDRFVYGEVERISPEAPIPVLRVERESSMPGGAGNVVRNLAALGGRAELVAVVGDDADGTIVRELLAANSRVRATILADPARTTTVKTRFVASGQQLLRADRESVRPLSASVAAAALDAARGAIARNRVVLLSDYGKGMLTAEIVAAVVAASRDAGCKVIVDPKGVDYARYRGAAVITPNRRELHEATAMPVTTDEEIVRAAEALRQNCAAEAVVVTRSRDGMTIVAAGAAPLHLSTDAREVFDVSGAGDTVAATLAAALAVDATLVQAAQLANAAAGVAVGKAGTAAVHASELLHALHAHDLAASQNKILGHDELRDRVATWRRQNLRIGFTNGCFDLLHPGHVSLLAQARAACDRLIVGLNADASVRRLKGENRPVQSEAARASVLASLAAVDAVVLFGEDTPLALIRSIRPDILAKGADYRIDQVVGADIVQSYGGRVVLAKLADGHSTTATIERLATRR